jgi:hypothetical protein
MGPCIKLLTCIGSAKFGPDPAVRRRSVEQDIVYGGRELQGQRRVGRAKTGDVHQLSATSGDPQLMLIMDVRTIGVLFWGWSHERDLL